MNKYFFILVMLFMVILSKPASAQKLAFSYDASGNQTERRWVCINCPNASGLTMTRSNKMADHPNNVSKQEGLNEISIERSITVYPNPVSETLNVSWKTPEKLSLKQIHVYGITGNRVFSSKYDPEQKQTQITFQQLPSGTYLLVAEYSDAKTETVKLIKL